MDLSNADWEVQRERRYSTNGIYWLNQHQLIIGRLHGRHLTITLRTRGGWFSFENYRKWGGNGWMIFIGRRNHHLSISLAWSGKR